MINVDLRLDAGFIVPIEPAETLAGHSLLVDDGRIVALVASRRASTAITRRASTSFFRSTC